tara:strand:- start:487 stop:1080 length:594 start_codon:yes stop_codon:yes gene_type:complete
MAKKKLLNEAQVRRFMSLSGLQPLKEMYGSKMEEDEMNENIYEDEEEADLPAEEPEMDDMEAAEPEMDAAPEAEAGEDEVSVTKDAIDAAGDAMMDLLGQLGYEGGEEAAEPEMEMDAEEPEMEMDAEEPEMDMGDEEAGGDEEVMEALSGVNLELNEDELVQEVAKRVAKRILKAKKAQQQLDEALGNKKRRTNRK